MHGSIEPWSVPKHRTSSEHFECSKPALHRAAEDTLWRGARRLQAAVECGGACISGLLARAAPGARFAARDLWKKAPVGGAAVTAATGLSMQVQGGGGAALVTLTLAA